MKHTIKPLLLAFACAAAVAACGDREAERAAQAAAQAAAIEAATLAASTAPEPGTVSAEEAALQRKQRRKSSVYEHNLENVREMAKEDPRLVAMIVRTWMSKDD